MAVASLFHPRWARTDGGLLQRLHIQTSCSLNEIADPPFQRIRFVQRMSFRLAHFLALELRRACSEIGPISRAGIIPFSSPRKTVTKCAGCLWTSFINFRSICD